MTIKTKLIISAALVALFSAPASALIEGDEGGLSAYPRFKKESVQMTDAAWRNHFVNRPHYR
jgi:hypothetical protein